MHDLCLGRKGWRWLRDPVQFWEAQILLFVVDGFGNLGCEVF